MLDELLMDEELVAQKKMQVLSRGQGRAKV